MLLLLVKVDSFIPTILPNLNPICHLLALGAHHILHVRRIRVNGKNVVDLVFSRLIVLPRFPDRLDVLPGCDLQSQKRQ
jgi:hypothetical protein